MFGLLVTKTDTIHLKEARDSAFRPGKFLNMTLLTQRLKYWWYSEHVLIKHTTTDFDLLMFAAAQILQTLL